MYSIRELYRIGCGPSSSHTMGPAKAATLFRQRFPQAEAFRIHLFGSLAATGKGHLTDMAVRHSLAPLDVTFLWQPEYMPAFHPNGMRPKPRPAGQVLGTGSVQRGRRIARNVATGWLLSLNNIRIRA
jgi:hypothetical protein